MLRAVPIPANPMPPVTAEKPAPAAVLTNTAF